LTNLPIFVFPSAANRENSFRFPGSRACVPVPPNCRPPLPWGAELHRREPNVFYIIVLIPLCWLGSPRIFLSSSLWVVRDPLVCCLLGPSVLGATTPFLAIFWPPGPCSFYPFPFFPHLSLIIFHSSRFLFLFSTSPPKFCSLIFFRILVFLPCLVLMCFFCRADNSA